MSVSTVSILYPIFAMVLLISIALTVLWKRRVAGIRSKQVTIKFYRAYSDNNEPEELRVASRHFVNLFEMPVLFYVVVMLAFVTQHVNFWMLACSWGYVVLRYVHSYVHLTNNNVIVRLQVYVASALVLLALWISLLVMLIRN